MSALELDGMREPIREYIRFAAAHPELFRLMVEEENSDDPRMHWLFARLMVP